MQFFGFNIAYIRVGCR